MKTYFINKYGLYFIIAVPVDRTKLKGRIFETKESLWDAISPLQTLDHDMLEDTEIKVFKDGDDLFWWFDNTGEKLEIDLYDFLNANLIL